MHIGITYSEKQEHNFNDTTVKAGQCVIGLQMDTDKCANQSGMIAYDTRRHLHDTKNYILQPVDHLTISLLISTNKYTSQVGMTASRTAWYMYTTKSGTNKCDKSSMNQSGQVFGFVWQIYDPKYYPQGPVADGSSVAAGDCPGLGEAPEYTPYH